MNKDNLIELKNPEPFVDDPITEILRNGAKKLLAEALEAEIAGFLSQYADFKDDQGRMRVTRNGYLPEREIQTGIGPVPAKAPRIRD
ncbi:MAG: IS256 family transposase, partial [Candidatus Desulfaltia sp.]|nr:IS256 family transposase [Candidatus Desulfaltia sp.]